MEGVEVNPGFWHDRKIFITGHTGFKGSWLTLWLHSLGAEVVGYALAPPSDPNLFEALGLQQNITHIHGDVRDYNSLLSIFRAHKPEIVFHLAAQSLVRLSYSEPRITYETNVMGTVNLLEAIRHTPSVRAVINVTSDKCYENREWVWGYRENDPMGGHDPYSSSKGCSELVTSAFLKSFFSPEKFNSKHNVALASARAGNVIGGGDWGTDRLVPDCIRSIISGQPVRLRNPDATRPWQHVLEPLSGYLLLAAKLYKDPFAYAGAWNFGPYPGDTRTVSEIAKRIVHVFGRGRIEIEPHDNIKYEAQTLQLNCDKALQKLGWKPRWNFDDTIDATVSWYKAIFDGADAAELTRRQLLDYSKELS